MSEESRFKRAAQALFPMLLALHAGHVSLATLLADPAKRVLSGLLAMAALNVAFLTFGVWSYLRLRQRHSTAPAIAVCVLCTLGSLVSLPLFAATMQELRWAFMFAYDAAYLALALGTLWCLIETRKDTRTNGG